MFTFTDDERAWHIEMRGITKNDRGHEVLVGLTEDETAFYMGYVRARVARASRSGGPNREDRARYLALGEKHEIARLAIIGGEIELRTENPSRH